ncbi:MAG: hypothetical protein ABEH88_00595 [Halobacteriales archaeon]
MSLAALANLGVIVGIFVVGFAVERRVRSDAKLEILPWYLQLLVGGLAISPITFFEDRLAVGPVDGLVVSFAVSIALWIALPAVLSQLVDRDRATAAPGC